MKLCTCITFCVLFVHTLSQVRSENCDKLGIVLYEDLGCQPIKTKDPCPRSFDCQNFAAPNQCLVQGKTYNYGDPIPKNSVGFSCQFGCFCTGQQNESTVSCAQFGCPEWSSIPPSAGCYRKYDLEACCSKENVCPPLTDDTKCLVDGREYKAGERFVPKDSCHVCLCQKGFNGKLQAPYCKRSGCDAQIHSQMAVQKYCAPVYIKRDEDGDKICCPQFWTCPDGTEDIKSSGQKSNFTCKFGEKTLQLGDSFEKRAKNVVMTYRVKCECKIPPLLTCQPL